MLATEILQEHPFLAFDYPQASALARQFLTLISGTLVFSLTFSEKIVRFGHASDHARSLMFFSWGGMILAMVTTGASVWFLYLSGWIVNHGQFAIDFRGFSVSLETSIDLSLIFLNTGGVLFVASLLALVAAGVVAHQTLGPDDIISGAGPAHSDRTEGGTQPDINHSQQPDGG